MSISYKHLYAITVSVSLLLLSGCGEEKKPKSPKSPPPLNVETVTVVKKKFPVWMQYTGMTKAVSDQEIRARVSGRLEKRFFEKSEDINVDLELSGAEFADIISRLDRIKISPQNVFIRLQFKKHLLIIYSLTSEYFLLIITDPDIIEGKMKFYLYWLIVRRESLRSWRSGTCRPGCGTLIPLQTPARSPGIGRCGTPATRLRGRETPVRRPPGRDSVLPRSHFGRPCGKCRPGWSPSCPGPGGGRRPGRRRRPLPLVS